MNKIKTGNSISDIIKENILIENEISIIDMEIKRLSKEIAIVNVDIYGCEDNLNSLARFNVINEIDGQTVYSEYNRIITRNNILKDKIEKLINKRLLLMQKKKILKKK